MNMEGEATANQLIVTQHLGPGDLTNTVASDQIGVPDSEEESSIIGHCERFRFKF